MNMADQLKFKEVYSQSINQPDIFWGKAAEDVIWNKKWDKVLDDSKKPFYHWFAGGELNTVTTLSTIRLNPGGENRRQLFMTAR